jgi:hypothetical protein
MSNYGNRYYRNTELVLEKIRLEVYCVRVSYTPRIIAGFVKPDGNYPTVVTNSQKYNTPDYSTAKEAIAHAKGWVDCMEHYYSCNQTDPDGNEDSYKNAYEENLLRHQENPDEEDAFSIASEEAVELAYQTGWEKKLSELKNIDGDVGD